MFYETPFKLYWFKFSPKINLPLTKDLFINLKEFRDLPPTDSLPKWLQKPGLSKTEARNFIQNSHMVGRVPASWAIFSCISQGISRGAGQKWNSWDTNWGLYELLVWQAMAFSPVWQWQPHKFTFNVNSVFSYKLMYPIICSFWYMPEWCCWMIGMFSFGLCSQNIFPKWLYYITFPSVLC